MSTMNDFKTPKSAIALTILGYFFFAIVFSTFLQLIGNGRNMSFAQTMSFKSDMVFYALLALTCWILASVIDHFAYKKQLKNEWVTFWKAPELGEKSENV